MSLHDVRLELAGKVTAQGVRAVTDPRDANPPCVIVGLPAGLSRRNACSIAGTVPVTAVAPPPGNDDAAVWLLELIEDLAPVLLWTDCVPATWSPGPNATDLPAYVMTVPIHT